MTTPEAHADRLAGLSSCESMLDQLKTIHLALRNRHVMIDRIAMAAYDDVTNTLRTLVSSNDGDNPLERYECRLSEAPGLEELFRERRPRVVPDLQVFDSGTALHTRRIAGQGFRSSYTLPVYGGRRFTGFVFFNSRTLDVFDETLLGELDVWGHLIGQIVEHELAGARILSGAIKTASDFVHSRDPETYGHLQRMARYARLIATQLSETGRHKLSDEEIERIYHFAPMHDLGKLGIPDNVLGKQARLDAEELQVMRQHSSIGASMLDRLIDNFDLGTIHGIDTLREVALMHHEALDGSGYPDGLAGDAIPIAARIVAVADIFDALTSVRPYKRAWSVEEAFEMLLQMAETKLDRNCVDALMEREEELRAIHHAFRDM